MHIYEPVPQYYASLEKVWSEHVDFVVLWRHQLFWFWFVGRHGVVQVCIGIAVGRLATRGSVGGAVCVGVCVGMYG